eukprot:scaffold25036_cov64-Cyclotella_meneghiniana.AAC.2
MAVISRVIHTYRGLIRASISQSSVDAKVVLEEGDVEVVADPEEDIRRVWEQKMLRLKQAIKFKMDLRKGGRLVTSGKECNVEGGYLTDVGILACDDPYHCVEDPSSRLGGVCVKVVNNPGAMADINQGGVRKAKRMYAFCFHRHWNSSGVFQ